MKAVIFAAGEGKRMRPLTETAPKPMLRVAGKPLIAYTFESLPDEVTEVIVVVGYKAEQIKEYIGDSFLGRSVRYVTQERVTGTARALMLAEPYLARDERFVVLCADDIYSKNDLEHLLTHDYGMLLTRVEDPSQFGVVELDAHGHVSDIEEKPVEPKSNLISTGVYLLSGNIFNYEAPQHANGEQYLPDMAVQFAKEYPLAGVESGSWIQIGYPRDLIAAEKILESRKIPTLNLSVLLGS